MDKNNNNTEGGDRSPKDRKAFNEWFESFDDSTGFLASLSFDEKQEHRENLFQKTKRQLDLEEDGQDQQNFLKKWMSPTSITPITKVAATLTIGILLSIAGFYLAQTFDFGASQQIAMVRKVNKVGELSKLTLPDSTTVWLGATSILKYPKEFTDSQRHVELDGEAYFKVTHNDTLPFIVTSGAVKTRVLGTEFNVKAYKEDQEATVTLTSGKVEVTSGSKEKAVTLSPDEQFRFNNESGIGEVRSINASMVNAWKDKELVFLRESFAQIAKTFERWYGVEFVFKDQSLKKEVFVYHFKEFSLPHSMKILSKLANFNYEINDDKVIISNQ